MPELPELEVVREVLQRRVVGQTITGVEVFPPGGPIVVRDLTHAGFTETLTGATFTKVLRLLKHGIPAVISGKDLSTNLLSLARRVKAARRPYQLLFSPK
jgi:formamidopyrimidine-DNA glycosylase